VLAAYLNQSHRLNWLAGASQTPYYFYLPSPVQTTGASPYDYIQTAQIERFIVRDVFAAGYYPLNRFTRVELGGHFANIDQSILQQDYGCVYNVGCEPVSDSRTQDLGSVSYYGPQVALVHDNTLFGWVGPFAGARSRLQISPSFGNWQFTEGLADVRRYFFARPFTFAFRGLVYGRRGRDADLFPQFLGSTELIRGYTAGSLLNNECVTADSTSTGPTGCPALDQLIGSSIGVFNAELRFPLTRSVVLGFLPVGLPPIEGALFYDVGLAWNNGSQVRLRQSACSNPDPEVCRVPLKSWGGSIRMNFLGFVVLRFDYTKPLDRLRNKSYWTVSLGPTF